MDIITYKLSQGDESKEYYDDIKQYSQEVIKILKENKSIVDEYMKFIVQSNIEGVRSYEEYLVEFLTIAVLLKIYAYPASRLGNVSKRTLQLLYGIRSEVSTIKPVVDKARGVLSTRYLYVDRSEYKEVVLDRESFLKLLDWMEASGEFRYTLNRLKMWEIFLKDKSNAYIDELLGRLDSTALWFQKESYKKLHKYTVKVDDFLSHVYEKHGLKEDILLCSKPEVEYHLNMVCAEILNNAFRKEFINTKRKIVLLPACMRAYKNDRCKANKTKMGLRCRHCNNYCNVNKITSIGEANNFETYIIPHESDALANGKEDNRDCGIIGVACVLNLLEGGWKAKEMNFIPQCIVLDYCGCQNHWHDKGIITRIDIERLLNLLNK